MYLFVVGLLLIVAFSFIAICSVFCCLFVPIFISATTYFIMRILLIASFAESILQFRGALIDAFSRSGLEVHVAGPGFGGQEELCGILQSKGIVVHDIALRRTGTNPLEDLFLLMQMVWLLLRVRPDFVLAYTIKPVIYGMLAATLVRVPKRFALITGLGYAFQGDGERGGLRSLVQRLYSVALRNVHKTFFQNPDDEKLFRALGLLSADAVSCVVNGSGVDLTTYAMAPLPRHCRFLLIARLLGDKGVREYAAAARRVRQKYPQVDFGLAGWIDESPNAISQGELDEWVSSGTLEFYGRLSDVRPAIASCSVYVLPSYREGTPRTVLEAMAMGRAIITTDAPGCRETVVDGENGFLVPVKSVDALEAAMLRLIDAPELVSQMGQRSREIGEDKYDVDKVNAVMLREMGIG